MLRKTALIILASCYAVAQIDIPTKSREWGKQSGSFQLSISSDKDKYAQGDIVQVNAVLKNVTDHPSIVLRVRPIIMFYDIDVRVPIPEWIPLKLQAGLTSFGRNEKDPLRSTGSSGGDLAPGGETADRFDLNRLYEMSTPGDYHITFSCKLPIQKITDPRVTITSNEITITIIGKQP